MNGVEHTIERLGAADAHRIPLVASMITVRFQSLDTAAWLVDDPDQRGTVMRDNIAMWAEHALDHGEIHIATNFIEVDSRSRRAAVPQAAAIWLHYDEPDTRRIPLPHGYHERLANDCGVYADNFAELDKLFDKHHPLDRGPHQYLAFLAAVHDGLGQGTALLRHHLDVLDSRELGAYLVAADKRSRDLYARHGFEPLEQVLQLPGGDHVMFPMWREPSGITDQSP